MFDDNVNPKKRGLGRGLDALFGDEEEGTELSKESQLQTLGLDQIEPNPSQPRELFDEQHLNELAESISTHGVLQPILVRPKEGQEGQFQIVAGERRWRASQIAQLHEVPVIVQELNDSETLQIALIENLQREDLNILEEAQSYRSLIDTYGFNQEKLAEVIGKSRSHIANTIRLLTLPESILKLLREDKLTAGHGRALLGAKDPEKLAKQVVSEGLSVRETEALVGDNSKKPRKEKKKASSSSVSAKDPDTLALEEEVSNALGMKVLLDIHGESGNVKIHFKDLDQLDNILHRLSHYPDN